MKKFDGYERRSLRMDGEQPTARDRWKSFYRLWRMASKYEERKRGVPLKTQTAFYCLGGRDIAGMVRLMGAREDHIDHTRIPVFLRRILLNSDRRRRIHGNYREDWWERNKEVATAMNEKGVEVTPEQVAEVRAKVINLARSKAREKGFYGLPKDDEDLLQWLNRKGR